MATIQNIPLNNYATGTTNLPEFSIQNGATNYTIYLARCTTATPTLWPNASTTVNVQLEWSTDGGSSWQPGGAFTDSGGVRSFKGSELANSAGSFTLPAGTGRLGRGTVTIANGPLRTQGRVDATP